MNVSGGGWAAAISCAVSFGAVGCGASSTAPGAAEGGALPVGAVGDAGGSVARDGGAFEAGAVAPDAATSRDSSGLFSCTGKAGVRGDVTVSLSSGGLDRTSLLHVPGSHDPARGAMLILNFHGYPSNGAQQAQLTRMNDASDAKNFLVAYPEGSSSGWNAGSCCISTAVDDVKFVRDLLVAIGSRYCIDPSRIYAAGMSNGGDMTHRLACEMSETFAAFAPVAGVLDVPTATCHPPTAVSILDFHGSKDTLAPYAGALAAVAHWRAEEGCADAGVTTFAKGDATCTECRGARGASVGFCTIDGGGHTWPGGLDVPLLGKTSTDLDANDAMISFFLSHPKG